MIKLLNSLLKTQGLDEQMTEKFENEFRGLILLALIATSQNRLGKGEEESLIEYFKTGNEEAVVNTLIAHYSKIEWEKMLNSEIKPIIQTYLKDVVMA